MNKTTKVGELKSRQPAKIEIPAFQTHCSSRTCGDGQSAAGQVSARHARRMKAAARPARSTVTDDFRALPQTLTLTHYGRPRSVQAVGVSGSVKLAQLSGGIVEMVVAVGDTVVELMPVLHVFGGASRLMKRKLRNAIDLGEERTFEQDPKYALRCPVNRLSSANSLLERKRPRMEGARSSGKPRSRQS